MSDTYNAPEPTTQTDGNVTVNVTTPTPAAPPRMATEAMVDAFLGRPAPGAAPATTRRAATYHEPAERHNLIWGLGKGMERPLLGALSLLPGIGQYFTRESWLGQRAYAPSEGIGENVGVAVGEVVPWLAGGEALTGTQLSARALGRIWDFSPTLARAIGSAYGGGTTRVGGLMASRFRSPSAIAKRAAVAGGVAGATQQPETTDPNQSWVERVGERVAPAAAGAAAGAALGLAGPALQRGATALAPAMRNLTSTQQRAVNWAMTGLAGAVAHDITGQLPLTIAAMYALHRAGLGVRAAHQLAPLVAAQATMIARASTRGAAAAGAAAGEVVNDLGATPR